MGKSSLIFKIEDLKEPESEVSQSLSSSREEDSDIASRIRVLNVSKHFSIPKPARAQEIKLDHTSYSIQVNTGLKLDAQSLHNRIFKPYLISNFTIL